ncbi:hypothetical protein C8J57DRAFT_1271356 [Mycena rebaudengoi]|nr:hypothetical protein C8J57DRAFT_1271356 [Mycena rebaudengoi]
MPDSKASIFRVISFTLAGGDVLQTIPGTYTLYKKQWVNRKLSPVCLFYAMARYMTIISLISNGIGFYGTHFTYETCRPWYMLPNITAMLAGMAVQILIFIRTYAISARSPIVYYGLGAILLAGFPVQCFGIVYHRGVQTTNGVCKGKVFQKNEMDWNIVYYSAHMIYDVIACTTATFYLVFSSRTQGVFNTSKFLRKVLRDGLLYAVVVFLANLWVVLEFHQVLKTGVGATLPLAIVMIAAQHLILSTQRARADMPSGTDESARSHSLGRRKGAPLRSPRVFGSPNAAQDVELQSAVFVVTETYLEPDERERERKTDGFVPDRYSPTDNKERDHGVGLAL